MSLDSAIEFISQWSSTSNNNSYIFTSTRDQVDQYLHCVDIIQRSILSGTSHDKIRAKTTMQIAMLRLTDEMYNMLKVNGKSTADPSSSTYSSTMTDSGSSSYIFEYEYSNELSVSVIADLQRIAETMNGAGYLLDCKKAYIGQRKRCIDVSYQKLVYKKLSSKDEAKKREWDQLVEIIRIWIKSSKICFRKVFPCDKRLSEEVFLDVGHDTSVACFVETVNDHANQLLDIASNLSCMGLASDRLFMILELYKAFFDLVPEMNKLFDTKLSESFKAKADQVLNELAGVATITVDKFEKDLVSADLSRPVQDDKIDSLCKYVMDYVFKLTKNKKTLMELSLSNPPSTSSAGINFTVMEPQLPNKLPYHMIWIIMCLVSKLESKAKSYKNASDISFFLMKSFRYIIKKIDSKPEVKEIFGNDCLGKLYAKFDQAKKDYLRLTFAKVLSVLGDKKSLKMRLKSFNTEFEELRTNLVGSKVPDFQLLKDLRVSIEDMLVPAYSSFLEEISCKSPHLMDDVKFTTEKLKTDILCFFPST